MPALPDTDFRPRTPAPPSGPTRYGIRKVLSTAKAFVKTNHDALYAGFLYGLSQAVPLALVVLDAR